MQLHIQKDSIAVSQELAEWITHTIETTLQTKDRFTWVVTGGNSPKLLYELLATGPYKERIDWQKLHIFWGDERAVPYADSRNNARMTFEQLLNHVPVVKEQVHIMKTDIAPETSAADYEQILHQYFAAEGTTFDLVLNGMGDDGHTLSLFPHTAVIHEATAWVKAFYLAPQEMYRITLTAPVVNRAARVAFLTFGANKNHALQEVLKGAHNVDQYPSQIIQPASGELHWFVDEAAAAGIQ
jgi:6-phosphogluconolactonase